MKGGRVHKCAGLIRAGSQSEFGPLQTRGGDSRVTGGGPRLGKLLQDIALDGLPQFWNIPPGRNELRWSAGALNWGVEAIGVGRLFG